LVADIAEEMKNIMKKNLALLTNITPANIAEMDNEIAAYVNIIQKPKTAIKNRKSRGTDPIPRLLNSADIPKKNIGRLVQSYLPDLLDEWDAFARIGRSTSIRHTSIAIQCTEISTGIRLKNVRVTITNDMDTLTKHTTRKGWVRFNSLENGIYSVTTEYHDYITDIRTNIGIIKDKMVRLDIKLKKKTC
jgi:hypothetical protein